MLTPHPTLVLVGSVGTEWEIKFYGISDKGNQTWLSFFIK